MRRKTTEREKTERNELTDLRQGVIRVHAPLHAKISMAIQLDNETKAKDVMARFDYENGSVEEEDDDDDDDYFLSQTVPPLILANAYYRDVWVYSNHSLFSLFSRSRGTRSTSRRPRQYLFEVGGNIGERSLDPETHLLDVYHVNPHCEWVLKPTTT
uniref:RHG40/28/18 C-terminal ubiquitin-like domain-containing protein n=1 Tax=Hucho hucho TaxID=62062 RepID=A0A4W5KGK0_9TELE